MFFVMCFACRSKYVSEQKDQRNGITHCIILNEKSQIGSTSGSCCIPKEKFFVKGRKWEGAERDNGGDQNCKIVRISRQFPINRDPIYFQLIRKHKSFIYWLECLNDLRGLDSGKSWTWSWLAGRQLGSTGPRSSPPWQCWGHLAAGSLRKHSWSRIWGKKRVSPSKIRAPLKNMNSMLW